MIQIQEYIIKELTRVGGLVAESARRNASWSSRIPGAISVDKPVVTGDRISIDIVVSLDSAPQAAAFEFGSGLTSELHAPMRYRIEGKNGKMLKFNFPESMNIYPTKEISIGGWHSMTDDNSYIDADESIIGGAAVPGAPALEYKNAEGLIYLPYVMHPGVKPRSFLKPAMKEGIEELSKGVMRVLVDYITDEVFTAGVNNSWE